jgi:putative Mg2+ transporter-C (MgtC) family protein
MFIHTILTDVNFQMVLRVLISIILGFTIGIERELTNKSAGLRTHILVCLGSTIFTLLSIYGFLGNDVASGIRITHDPARIAAQIITGIGFIGGGAVLRHGATISGLTTAASLWITSSVGMAVGAGFYTVAIIASILTLIVLVGVRKLERGVLIRHTRKGARVKISAVVNPDLAHETQDWFYNEFCEIIEMHVSKKPHKDEEYTKLTFVLDIYDSDPISKAYKKIKELKSVETLTLQQVLEDDK